ncbi:hypothetical protein M3204_13845 [Mesobacillus subterraneus]|uniref:hypothetical protein n=1 Tax=Mesobacillus subterraneus TaxID=285983 RepID=UPI00203D9256|nr:hypothetical protein [Mesobacillus subterraneus]MCM3665495.1 hypothetical protein [Mesobacillus subterraneus]MCM3686054.1 hypothetical protein [Mesobacillus subterraneus]
MNEFYLNYAKEKFGLSEQEAIKHKKVIQDSFGYNLAFLESELKKGTRNLLKVFLKESRLK